MITLNGVSKVYKSGENEVYALRELSLNINAGEFVAIVGTSGSGKTTLLNMLGCLDKPSSGVYNFGSTDATSLTDDALASFRNEKIGFIFQSFNLLSRTSALENVMLPFLYAKGEPSYHKAMQVLKRVGLGERMGHWPNQLSGGQQQRVAIARALINDPEIILADEPTGALDSNSSSEVLKLLQELNQDGVTIIMVTHDKTVANTAQRIVTMEDGQIISDQRIS